MDHTRRNFIQSGLLIAGTALTGANATAAETPPESSPSTENILGGDKFDPTKWLIVPPKTFEDLKVGDVFRVPKPHAHGCARV